MPGGRRRPRRACPWRPSPRRARGRSTNRFWILTFSPRRATMSLPDKWEELPLLERARLLEEASRRHAEAIRARQEDNRATLEETMIRLDATTNAPPLAPRDLETSVEHV